MALQTSPTQQDTMNLRALCDALGGIAVKWFKIGIQLGIPHNKLLEFQGSPDPLSAVIDYWLRGNVIESSNPISWDTIVTALSSKYVGEPGLAEEISKDYCWRKETSRGSDLPDPMKSCDQEEDKATNDSSTSPTQASTANPQYTMDPDMRLDLEFILEKNLKEIISKYASYVDTLRMTVKEKQIATDDLRSYLLSLSATTSKNRKGQKLALLSDKKAQLQQCNTVTNIFDLLTTECTSFLNYDIFQSIMKRYNIADDKEELKYSEHLKAYIKKHKISEFAKVNPLLKSKKDSKELTLKYDIETTCSLAKLEELRKLIAEIMEISPSALEIIDIEEGCVMVTFVLSAVIADVLFKPDTVFTPQQEEKLRAASVLWMKCNGHTFHFEQQNDAMHKLKEQLTCSICLGTYVDPKQLQCQHAYCQQCLMGLVRQDQQGQPTLTCPTCRQVTLVPASGVAGLQADFRANQLLEIFSKDKKVSSLAIPQLPSSDFALEELPKRETTSPFCPDHDKVLREVYCGTCKETICWKCSRSKHQGHFCEELDEAFARCNKDLLTLSKAIVSALTAIEALCSKISDQRIALEEEIHCTITIDDRKTELISQLHELTQTKLKNLAAQRDQLETVQAQLHAQRDNFQGDTSNQAEALLRKSSTVERVHKLTTTFQTDLLEPNTKADMIYSPPTIDKHGIVRSRQSLDVSKYCSIGKSVGIAIVGKTSTTILQTQYPIKVFSCELESEITGTKVRGSIKRAAAGHCQCQYKICYHPIIKGRHRLKIKVEGQDIRGSPFLITARSPVKTLHSPILAISCLRGPKGVAVNQRGEILAAEMSADCVTVFSPKGEKLRSFGIPGSSQGQFQTPYGIALDGDENILVTDHRNHRIQKFSPQGEFIASVGGPLKFQFPYGITFNASNNKVYVVDKSCQIQILNSDLSYLNTFGKKGHGLGEFTTPRFIACDSTGNVYVTDYKSHRIQVFTPKGKFMRVFASRDKPYGIAIDFSDRVYISDYQHHNVYVYTDEGQFITSFGSSGSEQGHLRRPSGLAVDDSGVVYVCDLGNNRIQLF